MSLSILDTNLGGVGGDTQKVFIRISYSKHEWWDFRALCKEFILHVAWFTFDCEDSCKTMLHALLLIWYSFKASVLGIFVVVSNGLNFFRIDLILFL